MYSASVKFIPKLEAFFILNKAPHLKWYTSYELSDKIRQHNYNDFEDYTPQEQAMLSFYIKNMATGDIPIPELFPLDNITFIKTIAGKEWDFPYTFITEDINVIVLSAKTVITWSKIGFNSRQVREVILHEIIHLHQKRYQSDYNYYYVNEYHFIPIEIKDYMTSSFRETVITNPDGYYFSDVIWAISINGQLWYPYLDISLKERMRKIEKRNSIYVITDESPTKEILKKYASMFPVESQRYHPNEIFARINAKKIIYPTIE